MLAPSYSVSYEGTETLDDGFDTAVVHTYAVRRDAGRIVCVFGAGVQDDARRAAETHAERRALWGPGPDARWYGNLHLVGGAV